jgi:hypothetical protein
MQGETGNCWIFAISTSATFFLAQLLHKLRSTCNVSFLCCGLLNDAFNIRTIHCLGNAIMVTSWSLFLMRNSFSVGPQLYANSARIMGMVHIWHSIYATHLYVTDTDTASMQPIFTLLILMFICCKISCTETPWLSETRFLSLSVFTWFCSCGGLYVVTICTTHFNKPKLYILPTECMCVFSMVLTINSDCLPEQH